VVGCHEPVWPLDGGLLSCSCSSILGYM
jgi:hypothetical protein